MSVGRRYNLIRPRPDRPIYKTPSPRGPSHHHALQHFTPPAPQPSQPDNSSTLGALRENSAPFLPRGLTMTTPSPTTFAIPPTTPPTTPVPAP